MSQPFALPSLKEIKGLQQLSPQNLDIIELPRVNVTQISFHLYGLRYTMNFDSQSGNLTPDGQDIHVAMVVLPEVLARILHRQGCVLRTVTYLDGTYDMEVAIGGAYFNPSLDGKSILLAHKQGLDRLRVTMEAFREAMQKLSRAEPVGESHP